MTIEEMADKLNGAHTDIINVVRDHYDMQLEFMSSFDKMTHNLQMLENKLLEEPEPEECEHCNALQSERVGVRCPEHSKQPKYFYGSGKAEEKAEIL